MQAHHNRHGTNLELLEEMEVLKEIVQQRLAALGIDDVNLENLEGEQRSPCPESQNEATRQ